VPDPLDRVGEQQGAGQNDGKADQQKDEFD
jgi:hypothetical protein